MYLNTSVTYILPLTLVDFLEGIREWATGNSSNETDYGPQTLKKSSIDSMSHLFLRELPRKVEEGSGTSPTPKS